MFTIKGILTVDERLAAILINFMRVFQAAKRTAYQAIRRGVKREEIISSLQSKFIRNARWCQWAYAEAGDTIRSQKELIDMYIHDLEAKIKKAEEKLERTKKSPHRKGILNRIEKLKNKLIYWQSHKEKGTVPPAVFGGKKNLIALTQGRLSKEEWKELRSNSFTSVGQANQKGLRGQQGNANTEIFFDGENFFLNIYLPPNDEDVKLGRGIPRRDEDWVTLPLSIPAPYVKYLAEHLATGRPYTVQVIRKKNRFFCHISFSLEDAKEVDRSLKMAGIDLNPQVISVTIVHPNGNYLISRNFPCPDLPYVSHEKRLHIIGSLCKEIAWWLKKQSVTQVALEELFFNQDHDTNRFFNRMSHNFSHKAMFTNLVIRLRKEGIAVFTVNPKFTSFIGFAKYKDTYGLAVHQAAALVIARRALGYKEKLPREIKRLLAPKEGQPHLSTWGKLFGIVKAARQKARKNGDYKKSWTIENYLTYAKLKVA
jgi:IS605 OrfB family transposase